MASSKASEKEVKTVLEAAANGQPIPSGFAFNPAYPDEPVWKIEGAPSPDHLVPPSYRKAGAPLTSDGNPGGHVPAAQPVPSDTGGNTPPNDNPPNRP